MLANCLCVELYTSLPIFLHKNCQLIAFELTFSTLCIPPTWRRW